MSKITIDRSVVEQALKLLDALSYDENYDYDGCFQHWADYARPEKLALQFRAALEQPQVEQEPVAWMNATGGTTFDPYRASCWRDSGPVTPLYTHPQNLRCKSQQARLATLWGYEKPQPPRQPLTVQEIDKLREAIGDGEDAPDAWSFMCGIRTAERQHEIGGEK